MCRALFLWMQRARPKHVGAARCRMILLLEGEKQVQKMEEIREPGTGPNRSDPLYPGVSWQDFCD